MVSKYQILDSIEELKQMRPSYTVCQKLEMWYSLLEHLYPEEVEREDLPQMIGYSHSSTPVVKVSEPNIIDVDPDSEFLQAVADKPHDEVFEILDEHFKVMKTINPKAYKRIIYELNKIAPY